MGVQLKINVERHSDGYIAYPLGVEGVVVGQGDSWQEALDDVKSAIVFHVDTFDLGSLSDGESLVEEALVEQADLTS